MISRSKKDFKLFTVMVAIMAFFYNIPQTMALEVETHRLINEFVAQNTLSGFSLDDYLKKQLGMHDGIKTDVKNQKIFLWVGDGGEKEDSYIGIRCLNHFHDPISNTGLAGQYSARQWALMDAGSQSVLFENYSWYDARSYYYTALTALDKLTRETHYAKTFRALGQVMHLVQDMSVPEHARKDIHLGSDYELWAKSKKATSISNYPSIPFIPTALYPLSIWNLFDTEQYNGTNPGIPVHGDMGLSEYSNANFLSPDKYLARVKNVEVQV